MVSVLPLKGLHILVVEDEAFLAFELVEDLEAVGAVPLGPIATVARALQFIETGARIDAALLNVMLHRQESFPVVDELRRRGIPCVFVTGNDNAVRERFPDVPVHLKPADMAAIVLTLAVLVRLDPVD
ncbi:response regulator [Lichenibacterium ramalinae]|jgi:CheY-like chemotaxis protein|uniref:Response regulator n=1 Tax=Lichenibacterium ramalinae TaxID=2316527 RepID=A0A4V1RHW2_9HYPH|nr:response regulator [Lichenibacterium ramalinae]RYB01437.1 response regulator [Lichenibacterium ramalinae]